MPLLSKAVYRWPTKLLRVSSPLKLRKTSYLCPKVVDGKEEEVLPVPRSIGNIYW